MMVTGLVFFLLSSSNANAQVGTPKFNLPMPYEKYNYWMLASDKLPEPGEELDQNFYEMDEKPPGTFIVYCEPLPDDPPSPYREGIDIGCFDKKKVKAVEPEPSKWRIPFVPWRTPTPADPYTVPANPVNIISDQERLNYLKFWAVRLELIEDLDKFETEFTVEKFTTPPGPAGINFLAAQVRARLLILQKSATEQNLITADATPTQRDAFNRTRQMMADGFKRHVRLLDRLYPDAALWYLLLKSKNKLIDQDEDEDEDKNK